MALSRWIASRLVERQPDGTEEPPGARGGLRLTEPNGGEVSVIARGDGFDLYFQPSGKKSVYNHAITTCSAMRLARYLIWWWVRHDWCGLKGRLWRWAQRRELERG